MIHKLPVGGIWEEKKIEVHLNEEFNESQTSDQPCPHAVFLRIKTTKYSKTNIYKEKVFSIPRVIVALNEGGHNSTGVCLDCVNEQIAKLNLA